MHMYGGHDEISISMLNTQLRLRFQLPTVNIDETLCTIINKLLTKIDHE